LVIDIDGTFLKTDMLFEGFWQALGKEPLATVKAAATLFFDRPRLKARIAEIADVRADLLPVNPAVLELVEQAKAQGREVIFASAADQYVVGRLAELYGLTGEHLASDGRTNMKGGTKAKALEARFGKGGFVYAGDAPADLPVWLSAAEAIVVGSHPAAARKLNAAGINVTELPKTWSRRSMVKSLRPHQWVKNVLLLLPLIAAHRFDAQGLAAVLVATTAFCAAASSIYLVNDLLDLEADRLHAKKRFRPVAAGDMKIPDAMLVSGALAVFALVAASLLGPGFVLATVLYMALSTLYSLKLKKIRWLDIATLASLFTLRVLAGALAAEVFASLWLLVFVFPAFLALGGVKRLTELTLARSDGRIPGRGYTPADRRSLLNTAIAATAVSLAVFYGYTFSDSARLLYHDLAVLRLAGVPFAIWQARMIYLGWHGEQDYDPLVFAMKDIKGIALVLITLGMILYASVGA
jgi:4-hydroxybenzoate polyprenyltransferase